MIPSASEAAAWTITRGHAMLLLDGARSTVDLDRPEGGIEIRQPGRNEPDRVLGVDLGTDCRRLDAWCRGADLTAVYERTTGTRLRATAMWRAAPAWHAAPATPEAWCRELVVSAQTPLPEAVPRIAVVTDVTAGDVAPARIGDGGIEAVAQDGRSHGFTMRTTCGGLLLFLVHPTDARSLDAHTVGGRARITAQLFPEAVEKGVLLRGRAMVALGPAARAGLPSWAHAVAAGFAASPPMLTT